MINPADLKQLAPTGKLRGGIVVSPAASAFFAITDDNDEVRGVTVDLMRAFADALKLPLALQVYSNSGQVTDAVAGGDCDVAFMPRDATREGKVDFGPAYYFISSTYLVPAGSAIKTIDEVSHVADDTSRLVNSGQSAIAGMESVLRQILEASGAITAKLAVLNEKTANINSVVTTFTKVADQTNLLSLNAAIEAEKAGEYGLGFAVVAVEIRRLADQTAVATYDIEKTVREMQTAVAAGVMGMDKFSEEARHGVEDVRSDAGRLGQILHQVQTLTSRFQIVNRGMHAQAAGTHQLGDTLGQLSESARQTAEALRQSNIAIGQVNETAQALQDSMARFKIGT